MPKPPDVGLTPYAVERFGGLNLRDDPEEVGFTGAVDLRDVDFDYYGRVRQRDGLTSRKTLTGYTEAGSPLWGFDDNLIVNANTGSQLDLLALDTSYAVSATKTNVGTATSAVAIGTAATSALYVATSSGVVKWNGTAWSAPAGIPLSDYLTVQRPDNRLVATISPTKVSFSDAGDPETFGANNYVNLGVGDAEVFAGAVTWRENTFVFKQTKFFKFFGNTTDGSGNPVFNYQTIDTGIGSSMDNVVAAPEGVYFGSLDGIYITTGGPPKKISGVLDPFFAGQTTPFFTPTLTAGIGWLTYVNNRLYVTVKCANDNAYRTFVYDPQLDVWSLWGLGTAYLAGWSASSSGASVRSKLFGTKTTTNKVYELTGTTDDGSNISSYYQSGFGDLGYAGSEKTIRETEIIGQGTVAFSWANDFGSQATASNVTLGTAPATDRNLHRDAACGESLSFKIASVSGGAWKVNGLRPMLREVRGPGEMAA